MSSVLSSIFLPVQLMLELLRTAVSVFYRFLPIVNKRVASPVAIEAMAMSRYSTQVTEIPTRSNLPKEAESNPHHVLKKGSPHHIVGFKNPYPSYAPPNIWAYVLKYVKYPITPDRR